MLPQFVTSSDISKVLGITQRRVQQLENEGVLIKNSDKKFELSKNIEIYYTWKLKPANNVNYDNERTLHEKAKRERIEMRNAKLRNELHAAADIKLVLTNMIVMFRSKMLSIPARISPRLVRQRDVNIINFELEKAIKDALTELSEYDPDMFNANGDEGDATKDN